MQVVTLYTPEELKELIHQAVKEALSDYFFPKSLPTEKDIEFLNSKQAAEFLNISTSTVYRLTSQRQIPHLKRGGRVYFKRSELVAWLGEGKQKTAEELKAEMGDLY